MRDDLERWDSAAGMENTRGLELEGKSSHSSLIDVCVDPEYWDCVTGMENTRGIEFDGESSRSSLRDVRADPEYWDCVTRVENTHGIELDRKSSRSSLKGVRVGATGGAEDGLNEEKRPLRKGRCRVFVFIPWLSVAL
jgi:hypothetical protein